MTHTEEINALAEGIASRDAEIERITVEGAVIIDDLNAEIRRLNEGWTQEVELAARCHRTYEETLAEKDQLITELADALEGASQWPPHQVLTQRAREAK